ncbi:MAG: septum formation initiator family protein [Solirubrobacteraceae bacterium]
MAAASTTRTRAGTRTSRPAAASIRWDRLSRYGLLIVFAVLLFLYVNPLRSYVGTLQESKQRQSEVQALQRENTALEARKRALANPDVVEAEARRLGMVRPGERPFVVRGLPRGR